MCALLCRCPSLSLPDDQRTAALNVLELLKQEGNSSNGVDLPDRAASETGLPLPKH